MRKNTDDLELSVFGELGDVNAREYIRSKYGIEAEKDAMKALEKFDADMRETEPGHYKKNK